jgi:hypothetical protein
MCIVRVLKKRTLTIRESVTKPPVGGSVHRAYDGQAALAIEPHPHPLGSHPDGNSPISPGLNTSRSSAISQQSSTKSSRSVQCLGTLVMLAARISANERMARRGMSQQHPDAASVDADNLAAKMQRMFSAITCGGQSRPSPTVHFAASHLAPLTVSHRARMQGRERQECKWAHGNMATTTRSPIRS